MNKFKNYGLWVAIAALIGMIVQDAGIQISPEKYQAYVDSILFILVIAGVISNPESGKWFKDKK